MTHTFCEACRGSDFHIYKMKNGKVIEQWSEINLLGLMAQISTPPPSTDAARK
jgi:hypothetical protein